MLRSIDISIDNPCKENFNDFKPTADGGYCQACAKEVIDFSSMTDAELFDFFKNQNGKVCGRFMPQQLGTIANPRKKKFNSWFRLAPLMGLLPFLFPTEGQAQTTVSSEMTEKKNIPAEKKEVSTPAGSVTISGKVIFEEDSLGVPGVAVFLKGIDEVSHTDINGQFSLTVSNIDQPAGSLIISFVGMETIEKKIDLTQRQIDLGKISMVSDVRVLGEIVIVYKPWSPRGIWYWIKNIFRR